MANPPISLVDVCTYYRGEKHQVNALKFLEEEILDYDSGLLDEFAEMWRKPLPEDKPPEPAPSGFRGTDTLADVIVKYFTRKGWRIKKPWSGYEVLIVGLEGATYAGNKKIKPNDDSHTQDAFNDCFAYFRVNKDGTVTTEMIFNGTTEPGIYYTKNRLNPAGAARTVIDSPQLDVWQVGWHKGREEALVQTGNKYCVTRDKNADFMRTGDPVTCGYYGINHHSAQGAGRIGRWSAGCQVVQMAEDLRKVIRFVKGGDLYQAQGRKAKYDYVCLDGAVIASLCEW